MMRDGIEKNNPKGKTEVKAETRSGALRGFRVRFVIAVILLGVFIYCDRTNVVYRGESADTFFARIIENMGIPLPRLISK